MLRTIGTRVFRHGVYSGGARYDSARGGSPLSAGFQTDLRATQHYAAASIPEHSIGINVAYDDFGSRDDDAVVVADVFSQRNPRHIFQHVHQFLFYLLNLFLALADVFQFFFDIALEFLQFFLPLFEFVCGCIHANVFLNGKGNQRPTPVGGAKVKSENGKL